MLKHGACGVPKRFAMSACSPGHLFMIPAEFQVPELPDLIIYMDALTRHLAKSRVERIIVRSPFVLRSVEPPLDAVFGKQVMAVERVGKRLVLGFERDLFLVIHLMIAGRLRWVARRDGASPKPPSPKLVLAALELEHGTLFFTEASSKKRASMRMVRGREALRALDPGGVEPLVATAGEFRAALSRENHTLKRALTDPRLFSGIGNAYSDEILHCAKLSPLKLTSSLTDEEFLRLHDATRTTLQAWIDRLRGETGDGFPEKVTAFRPEMAVHGRFRKPCPVCAAPVQRIVYADNECNYCARCQTGGRLLADRSMSRLLKDDWPRSIDDV
jgi:formamidopyrimidine-DNA glycosylase